MSRFRSPTLALVLLRVVAAVFALGLAGRGSAARASSTQSSIAPLAAAAQRTQRAHSTIERGAPVDASGRCAAAFTPHCELGLAVTEHSIVVAPAASSTLSEHVAVAPPSTRSQLVLPEARGPPAIG